METWKIVLIVLGCLILLAGIIAAIIVPIIIKKNKSKKQVKEEVQPEVKQPEVIQLKAVKLQSGSGMFGFESPEEIRKRLSTLTKEEFLALEIDDYPYNQEQWNALEGKPEEIYARNEYELGIFFAYNYRKELKSNGDVLRREF